MTDTTTQRLVPVRCFQCGQLLNVYQTAYDALLRAGVPAPRALAYLKVRDRCCRVNLCTPPDDVRLRRVLPQPRQFTKVAHEPPSATAYTLDTDGRGEERGEDTDVEEAEEEEEEEEEGAGDDRRGGSAAAPTTTAAASGRH